MRASVIGRRVRRHVAAAGWSVLGRGFQGRTAEGVRVQRSLSAAAMAGHGGGPFKVLFCGEEFPSALETTRRLLADDPEIQFENYPREEISEKIEQFHVVVPRMCRLSASTIARAKNAKLICQFGVGLEGVDIPAATSAGIHVSRISGTANRYNAISCAEHCIYLAMALLRDQHRMTSSLQNMLLGEPQGDTLYGKTVLIVGYGSIGQELAPRLKPFNVRVLAVRRSWGRSNGSKSIIGEDAEPIDSSNSDAQEVALRERRGESGRESEREGESEKGVEAVDERGGTEALPTFLPQADIVVMCCLLTKETAGMANAEFYGSMKKGALLVNIARGGLLDYSATWAALEGGRLGGLAADVAWQEPFDPTDAIATHPRVIITPHVGGVTKPSYETMARVMAATIRQVKNGETLTLVELANNVENGKP